MSALKPYWLEEKLILGSTTKPVDGEILVVGSGLSGVSCAYWLSYYGFENITIVDYIPEEAASFRNCGHILYGTVESMKALVAIHGIDTAKAIWKFSIEICHEVRETVFRHEMNVDYFQNGYLVIAIDETEDKEHKESIKILNELGFESSYIDRLKLENLGFQNIYGARFEKGSAQAHPVKFRNELLKECLKSGVKYYSGCKVESLDETSSNSIKIKTARGIINFDAVVLATNAFSPLISDFFRKRSLVEPFRGQIITSKPLNENIPIEIPHCFDHGYEYALKSSDNRLIIGGWRNHTAQGEVGTYDLTPNPKVEDGLKEFVQNHYKFKSKVDWEFSWSGIMAASKTGFPFIGPTDNPRIFTCAGFTGHGFSWAHGSAKLLAQIVAGKSHPVEIAKYFNPSQI